MRGLIYKDLLTLKSYRKTLLLFSVVYILVGIVNENNLYMLPIILPLIFFMASISTFSYDEQAKWDKFGLTLPTDRKEIVKSKYYFYIVLNILSIIISTILIYIVKTLLYNNIDFKELLMVIISSTFTIYIVGLIQIPIIYKYGVEKGRLQLFILFFIITLLIGSGALLVKNIIDLDVLSSQILKLFDNFKLFIPIILIILYYIFYKISYKISYNIYLKKEF